ncbi:hypothetical protein SESBI_10113 [Sesbania bispinosa]|nr:hypothetical protein SESBI_10113 [Sesbania bispinosa]
MQPHGAVHFLWCPSCLYPYSGEVLCFRIMGTSGEAICSSCLSPVMKSMWLEKERHFTQSVTSVGDPFIVEKNPHIHDPDDVFPGLVIKITTFTTSCIGRI